MSFHHPFGLMAINEKYPFQRFSLLIRIGGGGYRVLARLDHKRSRHFYHIFAMYTKARGSSDYPFELWLGRVSFRFL